MRKGAARWWRLSLELPGWLEDLLVLHLVERGAQGVEVREQEESCTLVVHLPGRRDVESLLESVGGCLRAIGRSRGERIVWGWDVQEVFDEGWKDAWKAHFCGARLSPRLAVRPSWEKSVGFDGAVVLEIDPGQAFGTGLHDTTRMCLEWIDEILGEHGAFSSDPGPQRGLDVGTGSGILAIAMAKLGVGEVWALDTDPVAVEAAKMNARKNGVADKVKVLEGSLDLLGGGRFRLAVANLTGSELARMAMGLRDCVEPSGHLVLSGVLREEKGGLIDLYRETGFDLLGSRDRGEWCGMLLRRTP
jgi:ribosomal protein L11 methyltransferase